MLVIKNPAANAGERRDPGIEPRNQEEPLEEAMATHSSIRAWRIPRTVARQAPLSQSRTQLQRLSTHAYYVDILNTIIYGIFFFRFFSIIDYYNINTSLFVFSLLHKNPVSPTWGRVPVESKACVPVFADLTANLRGPVQRFNGCVS